MEDLLKEQQRTNELLEKLICQNKNPNELLTVEQVHEEYKIGINMVRKIFQDPKLPVQRYTVPFKVIRYAMDKYVSEEHNYLSEKI